MKLKEKAINIAKKYHGEQMYGNVNYVYHLLKCAEVAEELHLNNDIIVACILHDIIEDTSASYKNIHDKFNTTIADIVYSVTCELGKTRRERKENTYPKIRKSDDAILVKICDRIANIRFSKGSSESKLSMYLKESKEFFANVISDRINYNLKISNANSLLENEYKCV